MQNGGISTFPSRFIISMSHWYTLYNPRISNDKQTMLKTLVNTIDNTNRPFDDKGNFSSEKRIGIAQIPSLCTLIQQQKIKKKLQYSSFVASHLLASAFSLKNVACEHAVLKKVWQLGSPTHFTDWKGRKSPLYGFLFAVCDFGLDNFGHRFIR